MSFAKIKWVNDTFLRIFISSLLFITLILVVLGCVTNSFSFQFHGLAGYALELLDIPSYREFSIIQLGLSVRDIYENPKASENIFSQFTYFLTVLAIPVTFIFIVIIL